MSHILGALATAAGDVNVALRPPLLEILVGTAYVVLAAVLPAAGMTAGITCSRSQNRDGPQCRRTLPVAAVWPGSVRVVVTVGVSDVTGWW
jgi:hypothetical protein